MYDPLPMPLTAEIFQSMDYSQILYVEITAPGGMGMAGGVLISIIENDEAVLYSTNYFINKELFNEVKETILKFADRYVHTEFSNPIVHFNFCYGGMGNDVFLKSNATITTLQEQLQFTCSGKEYTVKPSVDGIFNSISQWIEKRSNG